MTDSRLSDLTARYEQLEAGSAYVQFALARALTPTTSDALAVVERRLGPTHPHLALIKKAATDPTLYSDDWRGLRRLSDQFYALFRPATFFGQVVSSVRRVPFQVRTLVQATASNAKWAGEARPIKVSSALDLNLVALPRLKLGLIGVTTSELAKSTDAGAIAVVQRDLSRSIASGENDTLFDNQPAITGVRPAGLLFGVAPVGSFSPPDLEADVAAMITAVRGGEPQAPYFVVSPAGALFLATLRDANGVRTFPNVSFAGGDLLGVPVIVTGAAGSSLILLDVAALLVADDGVELAASEESTIQMDDNPDDPPSASTVELSLWQHNLIGIRAIRFLNWQLAFSDAVSFITLPV